MEIQNHDLGPVADLWVALQREAEHGNQHVREFLEQAFGPWATEQMRLRAN